MSGCYFSVTTTGLRKTNCDPIQGDRDLELPPRFPVCRADLKRLQYDTWGTQDCPGPLIPANRVPQPERELRNLAYSTFVCILTEPSIASSFPSKAYLLFLFFGIPKLPPQSPGKWPVSSCTSGWTHQLASFHWLLLVLAFICTHISIKGQDTFEQLGVLYRKAIISQNIHRGRTVLSVNLILVHRRFKTMPELKWL